MSLYKGGIYGVAPLRVQLSTSASCAAFVTQVSAFGENSSGAASRPVVYRASTPGAGSGIAQTLSQGGNDASTAVITNFSSLPSDPSYTSLTLKLPMSLFIVYPRRSEIVVYPSSNFNLFAQATGGHSWTGEIFFEER